MIKFLSITFLLMICCCINSIHSNEEYKCPKNQFYLYPCRCTANGYSGIDLQCNNSNLATISLALDNVKTPINHLIIIDSNITRLFGPLFKDKIIQSLSIHNSNLQKIDYECLNVNTNFKSIQLDTNRFLSIPEAIGIELSNLTKLTVINNEQSIVEIKANDFKKNVQLIELNLRNNSISKIDSSAFTPLTVLEKLDLSHNRLKKIERNQFRANKKLNYLDLSYNDFKELGKSDFNDLVSVNTLNLSYNDLREFPRSIFGRVSQLKVLNLSGNKFKQIDSYMLRGVRFLKELYASHNLIEGLAKNSFTSTTRIKLIDLSHNLMTEVETEIFKDMQWLDLIDLSYNHINKIKKGSFQRMFKIAIKLNNNNISTIEYKAFQELGNITELDLSNNHIEKLGANIFDECDCTIFKLNENQIKNLSNVDIFANLTGLRMLNLSRNFITEINRKHFTTKKLYELNTIDLSFNNITEISGNVFDKFLSIRHIILTNNLIEKINYNAFGSLPTLLELDLSHNQINEISNGGVSNLLSVKTIYLNDNKLKQMFPVSMAVNTLHLENNRIQSIGSNMFPMINAVLVVHLDNNNISQLDDNSFRQCLSLNTLTLKGNRLNEIPQRALAPLTSLQKLDLSFNQLKNLGRNALGTLNILFELDLSNNEIKNISENAFDGLLQLLALNISHNQLNQLTPDVFNTLVSLRTLDLSYNHLSNLDNRTHSLFGPLLSLERLNLSHNQISIIKDRSFPYSQWIPYKLRDLDLSYNTIPVLTSNFDNGLTKLNRLSLKGNIINEIHPNMLGNLTELEYLDLSENDLRKISKGVLQPTPKNLKELNLSVNKIKSLFVDDIKSISSLISLNLSSNRLSHIDEGLIERIKQNLTIYFNDNYLHCDCKIMPLVSWIFSQHHQSKLEGKQSTVYEHWRYLQCHEPMFVKNKFMVDLRANLVDCDEHERESYGKKFISTSSIRIRTIDKFRKRRQESMRIVWFVQNQIEDIASFQILLRAENNPNDYFINETVNYLKRSFIVNNHNLQPGNRYVLCIVPIDSMGITVYSNGDDRFEQHCIRFYNSHAHVIIDGDRTEQQSLNARKTNANLSLSSAALFFSSNILISHLILLSIILSYCLY